MKQKSSLTRTRRVMLLRSIGVLLSPVVMMVGLLACGTIVTETASYVCPTRLPNTVAPIVVGPGTPIVIPTLAPTSTPYRIFPPQDFYQGDAVFIGQPNASLRLRFRLQSVQSRPAPPRTLYVWSLEIKNLGTTMYETIPVAQAMITQIRTTSGDLDGSWLPTDKAMKAAGIVSENYDPLAPGLSRVYRMAAFGPVGSVRRIAFRLDEAGGNQITWINQTNPFCVGDIAD
jgi:hypothetical protein